MNYANVLVRNYPGTRWKMKNSSDYDTLEWYDESSKPSKDDLDAKLIELENAEPMRQLREERNRRLAKCDWIVTKNAEYGQNIPKEWRRYRQALRDLPSITYSLKMDDGVLKLDSVAWPTPPE